VLGYASMSEQTKVKLVALVGEHTILYDWKDPGYTRKGNIDLVGGKHRESLYDQVR
jgi:hypothetical protein